MERAISFKNRYLCIFIDALYSYYIYTKYLLNYNSAFKGYIIYLLFIIVSGFELFLCSRNIKMRIALGILYKSTPFEMSYDYSTEDSRIKDDISSLKGIKNSEFYEKYYARVKNNEDVKIKNAEFCLARDYAVLTFIKLPILVLLGVFTKTNLIMLLLLTLLAYIILVRISWRTAKDFVLQILVSIKE